MKGRVVAYWKLPVSVLIAVNKQSAISGVMVQLACLINRKISIDVTENVHRLVKKTQNHFYYEVYLQPSKIEVRGVSSRTFNNFCKS